MFSNQVAFDIVLHGLRQQGRFSYKTVGMNHDNGKPVIQCMYRAPNGDRCAAGMLMNDSWYRYDYEGCSASRINAFYDRGFNMSLLHELQMAHDKAASRENYGEGDAWEFWEDAMCKIASDFDLHYTERLTSIDVQEPAPVSGPDTAAYAKGYGIELSTVCELA